MQNFWIFPKFTEISRNTTTEILPNFTKLTKLTEAKQIWWKPYIQPKSIQVFISLFNEQNWIRSDDETIKIPLQRAASTVKHRPGSFNVQVDQLNKAVCLLYLVKSEMSSIRYF